MPVFEFVADILPTVVNVGASLIGQSQQEASQRDALDVYRKGAQEGANVLTDAYKEIEGDYEDLYDYTGLVNEGRMNALTEMMIGIPTEFENKMDDSVTEFGQRMTRGTDALWDGMMTADMLARADMDAANDRTQEMFAGHAASGEDARRAAMETMTADPSVLTPSQARAKEQYMRDARANLASSGLRGAGRAGVASVLEGLGELTARQHDENLRRGDAARNSLLNTGFQATGAQSRADMGTGMAKAGGTRGAMEGATRGTFAAQEKFANRGIEADKSVASNQDEWGRNMTNLMGNYYDRASGNEGARVKTREGLRMGSAGGQAAAVSNPAYAEAQSTLAKGRGRGEVIGEIGSAITDLFQDDD